MVVIKPELEEKLLVAAGAEENGSVSLLGLLDPLLDMIGDAKD